MTKMARRKKFRKHLSTLAISGVVLFMLVFVAIAGMRLKVQNTKKQERIDVLNEQIADEKERAEEIAEYGKYVQTKKYVEEMAKKLLNLVYEDEIIFKAKD